MLTGRPPIICTVLPTEERPLAYQKITQYNTIDIDPSPPHTRALWPSPRYPYTVEAL